MSFEDWMTERADAMGRARFVHEFENGHRGHVYTLTAAYDPFSARTQIRGCCKTCNQTVVLTVTDEEMTR